MLLDTSGLLCHQYASEPQHKQAISYFEAPDRKLIHNYVIAEFVALAHARRLSRLQALTFAGNLLLHPLIEVVWINEALHQRALALLHARPDKGYSLCDAVSFVLMQERGIIQALTNDHHFEQEGFQRLLKP